MTPSPDSSPDPAAVAARLRAEILHWNRIVNLTSRRGAERQLDQLLAQCEAGWTLVQGALADLGVDVAAIGYADIGSGNGLPGLVWAASIRAAGGTGRIWLVEPRQRRAWFLARQARRLGLHDLAVAPVRWGAPLAGASTVVDLVLSLKALRLTEPEVLQGVAGACQMGAEGPGGPSRVVVVRFLGPDPTADAALVRELQVPEGVQPWRLPFRPIQRQILSSEPARLLVTAYSRT